MRKKRIILKKIVMIILVIFGVFKSGLVKVQLTSSSHNKLPETFEVNDTEKLIDTNLNLFVSGMTFNTEPITNQKIKIKASKKINDTSYQIIFNKSVENYQFYLTNGRTYDSNVSDYNLSSDGKSVTLTCMNECKKDYPYALVYSDYFESPYILIGLYQIWLWEKQVQEMCLFSW